MGILNGKKKQEEEFAFETNDVLIVFDDESKTSDIRRITTIEDGTINVNGRYLIPEADCEITTGQEGRNYFYRAPQQSIRETMRLANLEKSIVLRQITDYKAPIPPAAMDWTKALLFGLVFIAFVILGLSGCHSSSASTPTTQAPTTATTTGGTK